MLRATEYKYEFNGYVYRFNHTDKKGWSVSSWKADQANIPLLTKQWTKFGWAPTLKTTLNKIKFFDTVEQAVEQITDLE